MKKGVLSLLLLTWILGAFYVPPTVHAYESERIETESVALPFYDDVLNNWKQLNYRDIDDSKVFYPDTMSFDLSTLKTTDDNRLILSWRTFDTVTIFTHIADAGLYSMALDYISTTTSIKSIKIQVAINDEIQYMEASRFTLPTLWSQKDEILTDRFGNDIVPTSYQLFEPMRFQFHDNVGLYKDPLRFKFNQGINKIELTLLEGQLDLYQLQFTEKAYVPSYEQYLSTIPTFYGQDTIHIEAERTSFKNDPSIRAGNDRDPRVTPFALMESRLNVLDGQTFNVGNQSIYYVFDVETEGIYHITLKVLQNGMVNTNVFRSMTLDGVIPFSEATSLKIPYDRDFQYFTLGSESPYAFYLEPGTHTIGLHVNISHNKDIYLGILDLMARMNTTTLDIQKITGNQTDASRDWDLRDYMPNLESDLYAYVNDVNMLYNAWIDIHGTGASPVSTTLRLAYERMVTVAEDPNELPINLTDFTIGSGSVLALIGNVLPELINSPLTLDSIIIHPENTELPKLHAGFFENLWIGIKRFFLSFFSDQYVTEGSDDEVEVWVNRGRAYVDLMQQMADTMYTPDSGQKVRISLMPDENKLILANAADAQPDIAMGIAAWRPFEFAVRDALYDLRYFEDFNDVSGRFAPGAFTGLIYQDGVYALPETQNFQLLFYRRDVLEKLNLEIPNTWFDVIDMLPELQRFGLNFYIPLANNAAFKSFDTTFPWISQFDGSLYAEDAMSVAFDDPNTIEALDMMTDLFKIYSLPVEVGSFYQRFRYGNLPIGIGDFGMYVQLLYAAPEIAGLWDIAMLPGIENENTSDINRSFVGASTVNVIFEASTKKNEAWAFLTWWSDAETQITYAENLITTYGPEFLWNTANLDAFLGMSWDSRHQQVIYEQWGHIYDPAKVPGSYMVERELSNIWNRVVYDGVNLRTAIEDGMVIANREITRKMIEFGYLDTQGNVIKPYLIPTPQTLIDWRDNDA